MKTHRFIHFFKSGRVHEFVEVVGDYSDGRKHKTHDSIIHIRGNENPFSIGMTREWSRFVDSMERTLKILTS